MRTRYAWLVSALSLVILATAGTLLRRPGGTSGDGPDTGPATSGPYPWGSGTPLDPSPLPSSTKRTLRHDGPSLDDAGRPFSMPSGRQPELDCQHARAIVKQVQTQLAFEPGRVDPARLAFSTSDWVDPYGLWTLSDDSPVGSELEARAAAILREIQSERGECQASRGVGGSLSRWVATLRGAFDAGRAGSTVSSSRALVEAFAEPAPLGLETARALGMQVGEAERLDPVLARYVDATRSRLFPELDGSAWERVVLAGVVRAYVPLVDAHGAWAPLDEEVSILEGELDAPPLGKLWERADRVPLGVRVHKTAHPVLMAGDVLLELGTMETAGLSLEQIEQLEFALGQSPTAVPAVVYRDGRIAKLLLEVSAERDAGPGQRVDPLRTEAIPYGEGQVLLVRIPEVRETLGDALLALIARQTIGTSTTLGIVLDLRGNGGGATDGATAALGLFLPGAPLFPMRRRDGSIEIDRAPPTPEAGRWAGAVATLVDSDTASAAEMIAGALATYGRGPSVGVQTYGKGCAQEYFDDDTSLGVLRLTTLVYALPDGTPVQRRGITPTISMAFSAPRGIPREREATLGAVPPLWQGPDIRTTGTRGVRQSYRVPWPKHEGRLGPCSDAEVCRALAELGRAK